MKKKRLRNLLSSLGAWMFEIGAIILSLTPRSLRPWIVSHLGLCFGWVARSMRKGLATNLTRLFQIDSDELDPLIDRIFENFALTLLDFFFPRNVTIDVPDRAKLEEIRAKHKGVLVLTFHIGHWELGARTMRQWGWAVSAVYQPYRNKRFKKVIESRRAPGVHFIPVGGKAAGGVGEALRRGDMVAMLGDHAFGEDGIPVKLFGHTIRWPKGPVVLAMKEKTPIVVAVITRTRAHHYLALIEDPLIPQSKSKAEVQRLVQAVADKFGKLVAQYPEQWYRFKAFDYVE